MGQKINPVLFRVKQRTVQQDDRNTDPTAVKKSLWYAGKSDYSTVLKRDIEIREYLLKQLARAGVVEVIIKMYIKRLEIDIWVSRPGMVIGKGGSGIEALKSNLIKKFKLPADLKLNIEEFKDENRSARVIANTIAQAVEKRVSYRRFIKNLIEKVKMSGVQGVMVEIGGRLNGAEIARTEKFSLGSVPRQTIRANIDYAAATSYTLAGTLGIKVWLNKSTVNDSIKS
ncbi:MAG: 30S ribosomal protein S3 [Patescibacteria group bacterium]